MRLADVLRNKNKSETTTHSSSPSEVKSEDISSVEEIPIHLIQGNRFQPRSEFDEEALAELASSIAEHGILHPVVVRSSSIGYELIVGERRLRACKQLGWTTIPAVVRNMNDRQSAEIALIENLQRQDLLLFEEAEGYRRLIDEFELTQEKLATRLGKNQSSIANKLRLLKLPVSVREIISREMLSERHARALLKINEESEQLAIVNKVVDEGLNVRETERVIDESLLPKPETNVEKQKRKLIVKDLRMFKNSVKSLAETLRLGGLDVEIEEREHSNSFELLVVVKKPPEVE